MIEAIIIDDEAPVRNSLTQIIKDNFNHVEIIGEADSVETGVDLLNNSKPDVVLLDINLSDGTGFNVLEKVDRINFQVIFITAYNEHAIKAFRFNALDYILKPIEIEYLGAALEKLNNLVQQAYITREELGKVLENFNKNDEDKKIALNEANRVTYVTLKDIVSCQADGNYTTFNLLDKTTIVTSKTLKSYELQLPETMFCRVHQSSIININYVKGYHKEEGGYVVLNDNTKIDISRRRKDAFLKLMQQKIS